MDYLEIKNLSLALPGFTLKDIQIKLPQGQSLVILGPSGAGKSVLLETIAGFYQPQDGEILLGGENITNLPPENRHVGFMFQDYALFPHRTVLQNISFALRFKSKANRDQNLDPRRVMDMLDIGHLADRLPATLSGGERQRVALARAMVRQPKLFLFDEPMSALDAQIRETLQEDLRQMKQSLTLTAVYVTHNHLEAQALGDVICIMNQGQIEQIGDVDEVFNHPATPWTAKFVGMENLFKGRVVYRIQGCGKQDLVKVNVNSLGLVTVQGRYDVHTGDEVLVGIRPENIMITADDHPGPPANTFSGRVTNLVPWGIVYKLKLEAGVSFTVYLSKLHQAQVNLAADTTVQLNLPADALHLIKL